MRPLLLLVLVPALMAHPLDTQAAEGTSGLLEEGTVGLSFRYRDEHVDDDAFDKNADASTLRSRLTLQSGQLRHISFLVEVDDVRELVLDNFDAGAGNTPGRSRYPVVADPEGTEVNQAYVDYEGLTDTRIRLGRQRINLDNQRFVGGVGWRQNEQTFDAVSVTYHGHGATVFYAAVDNVNRIFGEDVPAGDHRQNPTHLLNASINAGAVGRVTGYYYAIDDEDDPAFSTTTAGIRLDGSRDLDEARIDYLGEYARQGDLGSNPVSYHADYWHLNGGVTVTGLTVSLGWEVLTGNANRPGAAFRTPLATLHAFNGWVDRFLTTPDSGLDDRYVKVAAQPGGWTAEAIAHRFAAEDGGGDFGNEIDLHVGHGIGRAVRLDAFAGALDGHDGLGDVTKLWLMVTARL